MLLTTTSLTWYSASRARARERIVAGLVVGVPLAVGSAVVGNGAQEHASILYYVISVAVVIACLIAAVLAYLAASRISNASVRPRPRPLYLLLAAGYAAPVALFVRAAIAHVHLSAVGGWKPMTGGMLATCCAVGTLLMLGRALTWGRLRRAFWILPPHWFDQQLAVAAERQQR